MSTDDLEWLQEWYKSQCDGDWEHEYGIKIDTLDNPGWRITINLTGTEQEDIPFASITIEHSDNEWLFCEVKNKNFEAGGSPDSLSKILHIFRSWATQKP